MSREQATAQRRAEALLGMRPLCEMQAPRMRSLASAPLPDPASRVPRATLRSAPTQWGCDRPRIPPDTDGMACWSCSASRRRRA